MSWRALAVLVCPLLFACGADHECSGTITGDACLEVLGLTPTYWPYGTQVSTSNVDVVQATCAVRDPNTGQLTSVPEYFGDEDVVVSLANVPEPHNSPQLPNSSPAVTLENFRIQFSVRDCPSGATCPQLDDLELSPGNTVTVTPNSTTEFTLPLVPLLKKMEYVAKGGSTDKYPIYVAHYTMSSPTSADGDPSTRLEAWVDFTIGDFNECPGR